MGRGIEYQSKNGYIGKLYGNSSMIIRHISGFPNFHTDSTGIHTYEELKEAVEGFPDFIKLLQEVEE